MIEKYNVLSVDDNKNNLFTLNALLQTNKTIHSIEALNAKDALSILIKEKIDLILLDVQMPDINGFELAAMIKSNKKTKNIPIIFVTAVFKSEEFIKEGYDLGAVDYVTKPIDDNQLLNKISLYLKLFDEKKRLIQSEKRFYDIAQSIGDGVYTLNLKEELNFMNIQASKMLGFSSQELLGKKAHDYIHYKDVNNKPIKSSECKIHHTLLSGERYSSNNTFLVKKDGTMLNVSIVTSPLYVDNVITGIVVVFHNKSNQNHILDLEEEKIKNQEQIIHSMIDMIESRDSYTAGHTRRVAQYCEMIAKEMQYSNEEIELLRKAAWLHDIGKISTPDNVLLKPNKLDNTEYLLIQDHLTAGYEMLSKIDQYKFIADVMREHHEKYDGSGYPRGLRAEEIKPLSRIMIVADAFDAMTTNRVYKPRKSVNVALKELETLSAKHFHPEVVSAALITLKDIIICADISQLPKTKIEEQRFSYFYKDRLTNLFVVEYLSLIVRYYISKQSVYMYDIKLHNFSNYNTQNSWAKGDSFLVSFARHLDSLYSKAIVFRVEGDDFMILSEEPLADLDSKIKSSRLFDGDSIVSYSIEENYIKDITTLISS